MPPIDRFFIPTAIFDQIIRVPAGAGQPPAPANPGNYRLIEGVLAAGIVTTAVLPATQSATIPALQRTWDMELEEATPYAVATITPISGTGLTYSLVGSQAEGFSVSSAGVVSLWHLEKMLDQGIREQVANMKRRIFTVRATNGLSTSDCVLTVNLDTSTYAAQGRTAIPGLDVRTGRTSTNALRDPAVVAATLTGWSVNATTKNILQSADNPVPLVDLDLRTYQVVNNTFSGGVINQCLMGPPPNVYHNGHMGLIRSRAGTGTMTVTNCTFDMLPDLIKAGWDGLAGSYVNVTNVAILGAQNDGMNPTAGAFSNIYVSTDGVHNRDLLGAIRPNIIEWGHQDGIQPFGMSENFSFNNSLVICHARPYKYDARVRRPAGTAAFTNGSTAIEGTGTSWLTGSAANRINVGDYIRWALGQPFIVTAVNSDTSLTVGNPPTITISGRQLKAMPGEDASTGVTAPIFLEAVLPTGGTLEYDITVDNCIAIGGSLVVRGGGRANSLFNNIIRVTNISMADAAFGYIGTGTCPVFSVDFGTDLYTGAVVPPQRPMPVAPVVTKGASGVTYTTLAFTPQDPSILYEYRRRLTVGPGAWGAWTVLPANNQISGLTANTSYGFEVRGKNCLASNGVYLQIGPVGSITIATAASVTYDASTTALLASFTVQPTDAEKDAMDVMIRRLKTGGVWAKLDTLWSMADDNAQRVSKNWKNPGTFDASVVGTPTLNASKRGRTGFSTANYLTVPYSQWFTPANLSKQNDHSLFAWRADNSNANHYLLGNYRCAVGSKQFANSGAGRDSSSANNLVGVVSRSDGLWVLRRDNAANFQLFGNATTAAPAGSSTTQIANVAVASITVTDSPLIIGGANSNATGGFTQASPLASAGIIAFAGAGASLTNAQIATLDSAIYNYLSVLGRL
jgi:hypothetical protein